MPMEERAAAALEAREAPTQAHVSSSDRGASKGRNLFTKLGRKVLHTSPANHILSRPGLHVPISSVRDSFMPHMNWAQYNMQSPILPCFVHHNCLSDSDGHLIGSGCAHMSGRLISRD